MTPSNEELLEATHKVLRAGAHLIAQGYGRMALLPYLAPTGAWRCEFHVLGRPSRVLYRYSSADGAKYLVNHGGGSLARNASAPTLAAAIMERVSDSLRAQCIGLAADETTRWLQLLEGEMAASRVPIAFHEFSEPDEGWLSIVVGGNWQKRPMAAPPGYVVPGSERAQTTAP